MSIPVEVDRACPKTLPQPQRSARYRFRLQSYNYFRFRSAILEILGEGSVGWGWHIHRWKTYPKNIGIATEIASTSVSVANLLVLPVWGTVSTSVLYLMLFSEVGQCRYRWKWIGHALKHCRSRRDHLDIVFRRKVITTSGFRPPSCNFGWGWHNTSEKRAPNNIGTATEIASISVSVVKLLVLPVWGTVSTSDLYQMLFSEVGRCRYRWKWIGNARKLCRSLWHHVDISCRHQLITTSGFRPPFWIYKCRKCQTRLPWVWRKNLRTKIVGISSLASTEPDILLGVIYLQ